MAYAPDLPVETSRLRLRAFSRGDLDAVFAYRRREDVSLYLFDAPMTRETCAETVQRRMGLVGWAEDGDKIVLAVERLHDHAMIGEVSLVLRDTVARQGELGFIFNPEFHGQGYATEAARALMRMGFDDGGLHRIYARCDLRNVASYRVMERLGMQREAHFREHMLVKGEWAEELVYAVLARNWPRI